MAMYGMRALSTQRLSTILRHLRMSSTSAADAEVLLEKRGSAGVITLNRPKALNALTLNMIRSIHPQVHAWADDPGVHMMIIRGAGGKAFCAGGDVVAATESGKVGGSLAKDFFKEEYVVNNFIGTSSKPWVALIDGITMGGGVGLSVHGHFRVATEKTLFAMPETAIGLFPDVGGGYFLPRLSGKLGLYLALTGFRLKGRDVQKCGIATHYVDSDKIGQLESALLDLKAPKTTDVAQILDDFQQMSPNGADTPFVLADKMALINQMFSGDSLGQIYNNLEKDGSEWAAKTLQTLQKMSPTSMQITLRQLEEGAGMNLQQVLQMEYRLTQHILEDKDFYEGVRAVLVDKDQAPVWQPATVQEVTAQKLDWFFSPLPKGRDLEL